MNSDANIRTTVRNNALFHRIRWWHLLFVFALGAILLIGIISRKSRLQEWKRRMAAHGEKFTIAELVAGRRVQPDPVLPAVDAAYSTFHRLTIKRPQSAFSQSNLPRWQQEKLHGYDGCVMDWTSAREEMSAAADVFRQLKEALADPVADPQWDYESNPGSWGAIRAGTAPVTLAIRKRTAAQWLANSLLVALHEQQLSHALESLLALLRLAQWHEDDRLYMSQMIRVAIASLAAEATWEALHATGWNEPQLARLQNAWSKIALVSPLRKSMEMDRALSLAHFAAVRSSDAPIDASTTGPKPQMQARTEQLILAPLYLTLWAPADEWLYLELMQGYLDAIRHVERHRSFNAVVSAVSEQTNRFWESQQRFGKYRNFVTGQVMPGVHLGFRAAVKVQTLQQLTMAAIGVKRYQLRFGTPPAELSEFVPEFFPEVPIDFGNGQPLQYRNQGAGNFILYSRGSDGQDDEGNPAKDLIWNKPPWPNF